MATRATGTFEVRQGVDADYLQSTLTKDITPLEAVFDLVDNSVDAARERILRARNFDTDQYGLPQDYGRFAITVKVDEKGVELSDNCTGIDEPTLKNRAFVTGNVSEQRFGIGGFGIGLKRALFRLGRTYELVTDTGDAAAQMKFDRRMLSDSQKSLTAQRMNSSGKPKTKVLITDLETGVSHEFGAMTTDDWSKHLSRRYGLFIRKGLRIDVNAKRVPSFGPGLRKSGPVKPESFNNADDKRSGVQIYIDCGMHEKYKLRHEKGHSAARAASLTDQYGWYFVCNDRIVKIASRERELGWRANWHQEYYGFVGWVRFVAEDPEKLPWDTKKTSLDPNSEAFREIADRLQDFADDYRTRNRKARETSPKGEQGSTSHPGKPGTGGKGSQTSGKTTGGKSAKDHNENWLTLLPPLEAKATSMKLRALIYEATELGVESCYAGTMLLRSILERALVEHLKSSGRYADIRKIHAGKNLSEDKKEDFRPTLAQVLGWLAKNHDYFPADVRRECIAAVNKLARHLQELNGVIHETDLTDSGKLKIVRNDAMPLLIHIVGGK